MATPKIRDLPTDRLDSAANVAAWSVLIAAAYTLGFFAGGWFAPSVVDKPWISEYQGLIGTAATLATGLVAWVAVQRQITSQQNISQASRREAREFIVDSTTECLRQIDVVWLALEENVNSANAEEARPQKWKIINKAHVCSFEIESELNSLKEKFEYTKSSMAFDDRYKFSILLNLIERFINEFKEIRNAVTIQTGSYFDFSDTIDHKIEITIIQLSHVARAAKEFDYTLYSVFEKRKKAPVIWDPVSVHTRKFVSGTDL